MTEITLQVKIWRKLKCTIFYNIPCYCAFISLKEAGHFLESKHVNPDDTPRAIKGTVWGVFQLRRKTFFVAFKNPVVWKCLA